MKVCKLCKHLESEHGTLASIAAVDGSKIEACLWCNGWYLDGRVGKPARHRFVEES